MRSGCCSRRMSRFRKKRDVFLCLSIDRDLFCFWWVDTKIVVHWRTLDSDRRLLVSGKVCHRRLVESSAGVDIDSVEDIIILLRRFGSWDSRRLVLSGRCEKQATIRRKCKSAEE